MLEKEKLVFAKHFEKKEKNYLNKIKTLQQQIQNAEKIDVALLSKQNKEYESQITNLKTIIDKMNNKNNEDKSKFNEYVTDVIHLKNKLASELKDVEKLKKKISFDEESDKTSTGKNKIKFVLKNKPNEQDSETEIKKEEKESSKLNAGKRTSRELLKNVREVKESSSDSKNRSHSSIGDISMNKKVKSGILKQPKVTSDNFSNRSRRDQVEHINKSNTSKSSSLSADHKK